MSCLKQHQQSRNGKYQYYTIHFNSPPQKYIYIYIFYNLQSHELSLFPKKWGAGYPDGFKRNLFLHSKNMIYYAPRANPSNAL
jgi:hypothetical protein